MARVGVKIRGNISEDLLILGPRKTARQCNSTIPLNKLAMVQGLMRACIRARLYMSIDKYINNFLGMLCEWEHKT